MLMTNRATSHRIVKACLGLDLTHAHALGYKTTHQMRVRTTTTIIDSFLQ